MATNWVRTALSSLVVQAANAAKSAASLVLLTQPVDEDGDTFVVQAANAATSTASKVLSIQHLDEAGAVLKSLATVAQAGWVKITDGTLDLVFKAANTVGGAGTIVVPVQPLDEAGAVIKGGPGGVGGGAGIYSAKQLDCSIVYTATNQVTISGLPASLTVGNFVQVDVWDSTGLKTSRKPEDGTFAWNPATGVLTLGANDLAASDVDYDVLFWYTPKGYDAPGNQNVVHVSNPAWEQEGSFVIADVTNGTDATYNYYLSMDTYRKIGFMLTLDGGSGTVTVTVNGTWEQGTASALNYRDLTFKTFGVPSITADDELIDDMGTLSTCTWLRITVVASTGGANDADWTIEAKQIYG